ncbi:mechanosensitive ion channel family protein [Piscinibacter sp. HJYY11]|uniref:mechanosensitive ion channel family protein n=1 Tax=Piscinibacter sp. HJYY11 TaxID=2801333 RepID=UPI00191CFE37|nr:mechanosensitive ion channel domain-containing protein [Piscinibacter sp. HJYY11]MBL0727084.1 mechanosensitive ion channel [Piscinibacter sp. HJYY11]
MNNTTVDLQEFQELLRSLTTQSALTEAGVLLGCLGVSWLVCAALRRVLHIQGAVLFGRSVVDGVLFPVFALVLALIAKQLLVGVVKVAVFKVAIPILTSLLLIRLTVRVLTAAFPNSQWMRVIERFVSWIAWIAVVLWVTGVMPAVLEQLDGVRWKIGGAQISLRNLIEGTLTAGVVMVLALWISAAVERKIIRGTGDDLSMRKMAANIVRALLLFIGLLFAMSAVGIDLTALSVLGGAVGVGLGFGLQKIAANYVSGFVILAERSLRIGDMVKVDNFEGRITDIRTRYTVIRALNGREAIVPNEMLITQRVENSSLADPRLSISSTVQVAYGTDVQALQPKLVSAIAAVPRVLPDPAPAVQLSAFAADGMDLTLQFWIRDPENGQGAVKSEVNLAVLAVLNAEGIEIPFPQRVVHTRPLPAEATNKNAGE